MHYSPLMHLKAIVLRPLRAPKDSLWEALITSKLSLKEKDVIAISSKVVSIDEGETLPEDSMEKFELVKQYADSYYLAPDNVHRTIFTISKGIMVGSAGIDLSNGNGYYILYPTDPFKSAKKIRRKLMKHFSLKELGVIITDSVSLPLRRGAIGVALSWDGFDPLRDYRNTKDLFGRPFKMELANMVDGLAAGAVSVMGEGKESTPVVVISGSTVHFGKRRTKDSLMVAPEDDIFAPLLFKKGWKKNVQR